MKVSRLTVAEIVRTYGKEFLRSCGSRLPQYILYALWCMHHCGTEALGGEKRRCDSCGKETIIYKGCRHRACPHCENSHAARWMSARAKDLLPVHYFHVVFTLPHTLNDLVLRNQEAIYPLFFTAVKKTLITVGINNLKARLGFFGILHTWGQKMGFHPHIHCVVPGGGIALDGTRWIHSSQDKRYFVPSKVLALVFQGIFLRALRKAYRAGKLSAVTNLDSLIKDACKKKWVVHCKPPFGGPEQVLKYLSRYTRKVAISNSRLVSLKDGFVSFNFKDYADDYKTKICKLSVMEFIRRFLMHVPRPAFVRIRHFGFLSNTCRKKSLCLCREFLQHIQDYTTQFKEICPSKTCPECKLGILLLVAIIPSVRINTKWRDSS